MTGIKKQRIIILTDITPRTKEPDDYESMIRLLVHSNLFDIEGIIPTTSCWRKPGKLYSEVVHNIIDKYDQVRNNLLKHEDGFPKAEYLHSIVKEGNDGLGMDDVSLGESSEGFRHIIEVVDRPDSRPVWILLWGGANTLAQSLFHIKETCTEAYINEFISKIRVYEVQGQDDAGAWICNNFPDIFWLRNVMMNKGMSRQLNKDKWPEAYGGNEEIVSPEWFKQNIMEGHGVLGNNYPMARYKFEGDTPSFLYLMPVGLNDPMKPWEGSWGGRFSREKTKNPEGADNKLVQETQDKYFPFYMYTPAGDTWDYPNGVNAPYVDNIFCSLFRWREPFQNEFAARMDWCVMDYEEANHAPVAVVNGDLTRSVLPGEKVFLSAEGSHDPDGDSLKYDWYYYKEPGSYDGDITIENSNVCNAHFTAPEVNSPVEIHILLTVTDTGIPPLSRYQRVIIHVKPY